MKKVFLICLFLIGMMLTMQINAQTNTSFGVKLNGNMTNLRMTEMKNKNNSFGPGVSVGGFTRLEFSKYFALQPELMLSYSQGKIKITDEKLNYKYSSVNLPVYAVGQLEVGNGKFLLGVGPVIGYGFDAGSGKVKAGNASEIDDFWKPDKDNNIKLDLNQWYSGVVAFIGYELHSGLSFHAGYQGVQDFYSSKRKDKKMDIHTISLGLGYRF